jgi:hypothetical protein
VKFQSTWLDKKDKLGQIISTYCKRQDENHLLCLVCNVALKTSERFQSIEQHSLTLKHGKNATIKLNSNQQLRLALQKKRSLRF